MYSYGIMIILSTLTLLSKILTLYSRKMEAIPVFTNSKGESLPLTQITEKNIVSVNIAYLTESGTEKEMKIANKQISIHCLLKGTMIAIGLPSRLEEFEKIEQLDHDENSLYATFFNSGLCQLFFPLEGLKDIDWVNKPSA